GPSIVGRLLLHRRGLPRILLDDHLRVGRGLRLITRVADGGTRDPTGDGTEPGIARSGNDRTQNRARDRSDCGTCSRGRSRHHAHTLMRRNTGSARIEAGLFDGPEVAVITVAVLLLRRLTLLRIRVHVRNRPG